jgi:molybdopterin/thiamine biosynthesis adenylyltransferase
VTEVKRPRIKPVLNPAQLTDHRILIGMNQYGVGSEIQDDDDDTIWHLLALMDGTRAAADIVGAMQMAQPDLEADSLYAIIDTLTDAGFVEDAGAEPPSNLSAAELARHRRSADFYAWIDTQPRASPFDIQSRLKEASVTVLGLGGSGSAMVMSLVAAGVGAVHCVDFDIVEVSNLSRQLLYTEDDVGQPKVARAVDRLQRLNSHVHVTGETRQVTSPAEIVDLMRGRSLFILCADKPTWLIQRWTNEAALRSSTPWLMSLYAGPMLVAGLFLPWQTPCYRCLEHNEALRRGDRLDGELPATTPEINAVIAPTANLTGHLGALEAIYFLGGLQPQTVGRIFHLNLMIYDHLYYVEPPRWELCPACGPTSPFR